MPIESADSHLIGRATDMGLPPSRMAEASLHPDLWPHRPGLRVPPPGPAGGSLPAQCNNGRWLVQCPTCLSAQYTSKVDRRFFCGECSNSAFGGAWVTVTWPDAVDDIEAVLLGRPDPRNHNWEPVKNDGTVETVADLIAENDTHKVPVPPAIRNRHGAGT
jgi:hypothetical protein